MVVFPFRLSKRLDSVSEKLHFPSHKREALMKSIQVWSHPVKLGLLKHGAELSSGSSPLQPSPFTGLSGLLEIQTLPVSSVMGTCRPFVSFQPSLSSSFLLLKRSYKIFRVFQDPQTSPLWLIPQSLGFLRDSSHRR